MTYCVHCTVYPWISWEIGWLYSVTPPAPLSRLLDRHFETTWTVFFLLGYFMLRIHNNHGDNVMRSYHANKRLSYSRTECGNSYSSKFLLTYEYMYCTLFSLCLSTAYMYAIHDSAVFQSVRNIWLAAVLSFLRFSQCSFLFKEFTNFTYVHLSIFSLLTPSK